MSQGDRAAVRADTREALPADADDIARLLGDLGYPSPPSAVARRLAALSSFAATRTVVAVAEGEIVGVAGFLAFPVLHADPPAGRLTVLVVVGTHRGRGIGRTLVGAVEALAREAGCAVLEVTSGVHRPDAHAFYVAMGFEERPKRFVKRLSRPGETTDAKETAAQ